MDSFIRRRWRFSAGYLLLALGVLALLRGWHAAASEPEQLNWNEFLALVDHDEIEEAVIEPTRIVAITRETRAGGRPAQRVTTSRLPQIDDSALIERLRSESVALRGQVGEPSWFSRLLLSWWLPLSLLAGGYAWGMRRLGKTAGPLNFCSGRFQIYDQCRRRAASLAELAGVDRAKAELMEAVGLLKHPDGYRALGARLPKGVLILGAAGSGKSSLARAAASAVGVPLYSISGAEFAEMFVGARVARVAQLLLQLEQRAPCIFFIDELAALCRDGTGLRVGAAPAEALRRLLIGADGFDGAGVLIIAATSRSELADKHWLLPAIFERRIVIDSPDLAEREAILAVHAHRLRLAPDLDLRSVARRTAGLAGADLVHLTNEAALAALRRGASAVEQRDFVEALHRVQPWPAAEAAQEAEAAPWPSETTLC